MSRGVIVWLVVALTFLGYGAAGAGSATRQNCATNLSIHVTAGYSNVGSLVSVGILPDGGYRLAVVSGKKFIRLLRRRSKTYYFWEILSGGPPPGLTFSWGVDENGAAKQFLSGVPASPDVVGAFTFTVGVADWTNFGTPGATINGYSTGNCPVAGQRKGAVAVVDLDPVLTEAQVAVADISRSRKGQQEQGQRVGQNGRAACERPGQGRRRCPPTCGSRVAGLEAGGHGHSDSGRARRNRVRPLRTTGERSLRWSGDVARARGRSEERRGDGSRDRPGHVSDGVRRDRSEPLEERSGAV